jgi:RHS repeat-associated protein
MLQRTAPKFGCLFLVTMSAAWLSSCGSGETSSATSEDQEQQAQALALAPPAKARPSDASLIDVSSSRGADAGGDASATQDDASRTPVDETSRATGLLTSLRARFRVKVPPNPREEDPANGGNPNPGRPDGGAGAAATVPVLGPGLANRFDKGSNGVFPSFAAEGGPRSARLTLSKTATAPLRVENVESGMAVEVTLRDGRDVPAESAQGYLIYPSGHASGATLLHRALADGVEDYWSFDNRPATPTVAYDVALRQGVSGLRLIANTLEMLDSEGTPRLRVSPPTLMGANGNVVEASLSLDNCAYDADPAPPWGRAVVAPGAESCTVRVIWSEEGLVYPALLDPKWSTTGSMSKKRTDHTATLLSNGKVLVVGGNDETVVFSSAELYDRTTGTWSATGSMTGARMLHTATLLPTSSNATTSGKVLVAGGYNGSSTLNTAQLYSPTAGTWTAAANLNASRKEHTATLLANGKVLVAGGANGSTILNTAAVYNPATGTGSWAAVANMATARRYHTATLLTTSNTTLSNKVLVVGGRSSSASVTSVQAFDSTNSTWSTLTSLSSAREQHTATVVANGKVLVAGGKNGSSTLNTTLVFNPASGSGSWTSGGNMTSARHGQSATLLSSAVLNNGQVLVAGGWNGSAVLSSAELWNGTSAWALTTPLPEAVKYQTETLLSNGMVLIAGGVDEDVDPVSKAYIYDPSRGSPCTTPTQCASGFCASGVCCNTACTDACGQCNLTGSAGTCSPKANGTACSDEGNPCTVDKCNGSSLSCQHPAGNAGAICRLASGICDRSESCSGTSASCPPDLKEPDGTVCSDNNVCTGVDKCTSGVCTGVPGPVGTGCSDGLFCNGAETCSALGACTPGTPPQTDDGNRCTEDRCDEATDTITNTRLPAGTSCADGVTCQVGTCNDVGVCIGCNAPHCSNGVRDGNETGVDCGGSCPACAGGGCGSDSDCASGLVCGVNNGACFGQSRANRVCWAPTCQGGGNTAACGAADSACGINCACVNPCDATDAGTACPPGEVCKAGVGLVFSAPFPDVCVDPRCPSNDPALCGQSDSLCGSTCVCTPNCSAATCANPGDGCGGVCTGACPAGSTGCTVDATCPPGFACIASDDGAKTCRPADCAYRQMVPPLCGVPGAPCGEQCPACTPRCDGRACGADPNCGQSCGTCEAGQVCDGEGQCQAPAVTPPIMVTDDQGNSQPVLTAPPPPPSLVGAMPGAFSVTEQGTSEYTIPIDVPPGRAGIQPSLALKYGGSRANGDVGMGWRLDGLSQITRCPRVQALDNSGGPVKGTTEDHFCIDGKRLESVGGLNGGLPGSYGADGTQYRTLVDTFARIISKKASGSGIQPDPVAGVSIVPPGQQGPDSFEVRTKDGKILTYGGSRDSIAMADNGVRYGWFLSGVRDRVDNYMTILYLNVRVMRPVSTDGGTGVANLIKPLVINYTGHGHTGGTRVVIFGYEARPDPQHRVLQGGVAFMADQRLNHIYTFVDGMAVKNYHLQYENVGPASPVSRISDIFECTGVANDCKNPTHFDYEAVDTSYALGDAPLLASDESAGKLDVTGDGIPDYLTMKAIQKPVDADPKIAAAQIAAEVGLAVATSGMSIAASLAIHAAYSLISPSFWGLFAKDPAFEFHNVMYLGTGDRSGQLTRVNNVTGLPCGNGTATWIFDYNRDGRDDVLGSCLSSGGADINVSQSNGGQFIPIGTVATVPVFDCNRDPFDPPLSTFGCPKLPSAVFVDINGDSLEDLLYCSDKHTLVARRRLAPGLGFETPLPGVPSTYCSEEHPTFNVFDVDGDGSADLLAHVRGDVLAGITAGWKVLRYAPSQNPPLRWDAVDLPDVGNSALGEGLALADFNGDGLMDIYGRPKSSTEAKVVVWLNGGANRFVPRTLLRSLPAPNPIYGAFSLQQQAFLDNNFDGRGDILESWIARGASKAFFHTQALYPSSLVSRLDVENVPLFWPSDIAGLPNDPGGFRLAADLDGDGNTDLFGNKKAFYRNGKPSNRLLSRVVDGAGRLTVIRYDEDNGAEPTYSSSLPGDQNTWPVNRLPRMTGLVGSHDEGYVNGNSQDVVERSYEYKYFNARMNLTGEGWIGFDRRKVRAWVNSGSVLRLVQDVTTDYASSQLDTYQPNGDRTGISSAPTVPYLYPLAGLPTSVMVDNYPLDFGTPPPGIENGSYVRRSSVVNDWQVKKSAFGRGFPYLRSQLKTSYDKVLGAPPEELGTLLSYCVTVNESDDFGNVTMSQERCQGNVNIPTGSAAEENTTFIEPERNVDQWLISNPHHVSKISSMGDQTERQEWILGYENGLLVSSTRAPEDLDQTKPQQTIYSRDEYGNAYRIIKQEFTGEPERPIDIQYGADKIYPTSITNTLGQTTEVRFDPKWGALTVSVDPNRIVSTRVYDDFGKIVTATGPAGTTTFTYGDAFFAAPGHVQHVQLMMESQGIYGSRSGAVLKEYDHHGQLVRTMTEGKDGALVFQDWTFDNLGRPLTASAPHADPNPATAPKETYSYNRLHRVRRVEHADHTFIEYQYASAATLDPSHNNWWYGLPCEPGDATPSCVVDFVRSVDEEGRERIAITNHHGQVVQLIDGDYPLSIHPKSNKFLYGPFNLLRSIRDNDDHITQFNIDNYGRRRAMLDPNVGWSYSTYNGFDELKTAKDPQEQTRGYNYDGLGRISQIDEPNGGATLYLYDGGPNAIGRLSETVSPSTAENPAGNHMVYRYETEAFGGTKRGFLEQIATTLDGTEYATRFDYDDAGRIERIYYPNLDMGEPIVAKYNYDPSGIMYRIDEEGSGTARLLWELTEVSEGHLLRRETFGNGASTQYTYDPNRRWLTNIETTASVGVAQSIDYVRFNNGLVHFRTTATGQREFAYDNSNRLYSSIETPPGGTAVETPFRYDAIGNIITRGSKTLTYLPEQPHLVNAAGGNVYSYDANGNVTFRSGPDIPGGAQSFEYTPFNLPHSVHTGTGPSAKDTLFEYTADEARVIRRDADTTRYFVGDLYQCVTETNSQTTIEERFSLFAGGRPFAEVIRRGGIDEIQYFHTDHQGTVDAVTSGGGSVTLQEFDPFGAPIDPPVPALTRLGFTGHQHDNDLGLIDMKGRIYDPIAARFMSADPLMQPSSTDGLNRYSYAMNDPVNNIDPTGFDSRAVSDGIGFGLIVAWLPGGAALSTLFSGGGAGAASAGAAAGGGGGFPVAGLAGLGLDLAVNGVTGLGMPREGRTTTTNVPSGARRPPTGGGLGTPNAAAQRAGVGPGFDTAGAAAVDALEKIVEQSVVNNEELGGLVFRIGGRYFATQAIRGGYNAVDIWKALKDVPEGATIVGDYHTHPRTIGIEKRWWRNGDVFSGTDFPYMKAERPDLVSDKSFDSTDLGEARLDITEGPQINGVRKEGALTRIDTSRFTSFVRTPSGRLGVHNVAQGNIFYFSPNARMLAPPSELRALTYAH